MTAEESSVLTQESETQNASFWFCFNTTFDSWKVIQD